MAQSISYNPGAGLSGMLKSGTKHMEGLEASTFKNIAAAKELSNIVSSSLGPNGMNKLVINHLEKIIVTSDCCTIVKELEIEHPAAKILVMAAQSQEEECGDATNLTVSFAGELLSGTEELVRMGLHTSEVAVGYKKAGDYLFNNLLPALGDSNSVKNLRDVDELIRLVKPVLASKQFGCQDILAPLVAEACSSVMTGAEMTPSLSPANVRVSKILGGSISQSRVIHGMVFLRGAETTVTSVSESKVTVFNCGIEASQTEAKGTVLMQNAEDLKSYNISEEKKMEEIIQSIAETNTKLIVTGGSVSEMALHFMDRYQLMCLKIPSKWDVRRFCAATNSSALVRLGPATPDEMGYCSSAMVKEIGGKHVTIVQNSQKESRISTVLLHASTSSVLQDLERAIDDGVHTIKSACKDSRLVPGAGATEMHLSMKIKEFADTCPGLDQYAIRGFAKALEFVPRTLARNCGQYDVSDVLASLGAAHANGQNTMGVDVTGESINGIKDVSEETIFDLLATKQSALTFAIDSAITILRVDQIIMSKQAGIGQNPMMQ